MARPAGRRYGGSRKPTGYTCESCGEFRQTWTAAQHHEDQNPTHTMRADWRSIDQIRNPK